MMGYGDGRVDLGAPNLDTAHLAVARRNAKGHQKNATQWREFSNKLKRQGEEAIRQRNHYMAELAACEIERDALIATLNEFRKQYAPDVPKNEVIASFEKILAERQTGQG